MTSATHLAILIKSAPVTLERCDDVLHGVCKVFLLVNICMRYTSFCVHQKDPRRSWKDLIAATANEVSMPYHPRKMLQRTGDVKPVLQRARVPLIPGRKRN